MTAYRDEVAALRHRLEQVTTRADRAERRLEALELARDRRWSGDIALFLVRCLMIVVPLGLAMWFVAFFGIGVVMFDLFDDTRGLMALFALFVSPLFVAGPLAAWKTEAPSRSGWGLALFTHLYMLVVVPPVALFGLAVLLRARVRDAVFGAPSSRTRVELPEVVDSAAREDEAEAVGIKTSRSAREAS